MGSVPIRLLLGIVAVVSLLATPYMTLMPVLVREVYGADANVMGFLVGAAGLGGVLGTLVLASQPNVRGLVGVIAGASLAAGTALAAVSWAGAVPVAMALMMVVGFGILVTSVSVNMILQTIVHDDLRTKPVPDVRLICVFAFFERPEVAEGKHRGLQDIFELHGRVRDG